MSADSDHEDNDDFKESTDVVPLIEEAESTAAFSPEHHTLLWRLYISHALSTWGDRMWAFSVSLFFIEIWPESIMLVAVYGLVVDVIQVLFGAHAGDYVDRTARLSAVRSTLVAENICIALCVASLIIILAQGRENLGEGWFWGLVTFAMTFGSLSEIANMASSIAVGKDWVMVIAGSHSQQLAKTNAILRRIDLTCNILSPMAVGLIMSTRGVLAGAIAVASWNVITLIPEYLLLRRVYYSFPALAVKQSKVSQTAGMSFAQKTFKQILVLKTGWTTYWSQSIAIPGFALAMIYCTVLSFGSVMTAYLYSRGVAEVTLAGLRGLAAVFGVLATFLFIPLHKRVGLIRSGTMAIWFQCSALVACLIALFIGSNQTGDCTSDNDDETACVLRRNTEIALLAGGVIVSRAGLWTFDLSVSQQLQERVHPNLIGIVNGVQGSMSTGFDMLIYILSIILSQTSQFKYLVAVSIAVVFLAAVLYSSYATVSKESVKADPLASEDENELMLRDVVSEDEAAD